MPELTPRLGIKKPIGTENATRQSFNENWDIVDQNVETITGAQSKANQAETNAKTYVDEKALLKSGGIVTGDVTLEHGALLKSKDSNGIIKPLAYISTGDANVFGNANGVTYIYGNDLIYSNGTTPNKIWHQGNQGHGSLLNADLLDQKHADDFQNSIAPTSSFEDPNTTTKSLIITDHVNVPHKVNINYWYIQTLFYSQKAGNRSQMAIPYSAIEPTMFVRYCYQGVWSSWKEIGGGGVKTVQRGITEIANSTKLATAYISVVDPSKTMVNLLGFTFTGTSSSSAFSGAPHIRLNGNNQVIIERGADQAQTWVSWEVIEYA